MASAVEMSVVIPAYNEATRLPRYLRECIDYLECKYPRTYEIVVVDDGSLDGTVDRILRISRGIPLRIIRHDANRGKGAAVRTGMLTAGGELRVYTDADGATPIHELGVLVNCIELGADIAVGSRAVLGARAIAGSCGGRNNRWRIIGIECRSKETLDGSGPPQEPGMNLRGSVGEPMTRVRRFSPCRQLLGRVYTAAVDLFLGLGIHDTQCGFKLFRRSAAEDIFRHMRSEGFVFDAEVLSIALTRGYRVVEVPVNWHEVPGSKVNLAKDPLDMLRGLYRISKRVLKNQHKSRRSLC